MSSAPHRAAVPQAAPIDYDRLEEYLRALAHGRRLELLNILRVPRALADIRITPGRRRLFERPDRYVSRQAVQRHLEILQEVGFVVATPAKPHGKDFVVDPQRVYQVLEELRRVGTATAGAFVSRDETVDGQGASAHEVDPGPKLVLVHGFVEGKVFPLRSRDVGPGGGWVVGRKPDLHVSLDYDPFVSLLNSEVRLEGREYVVSDLGSSRNGTWVNWRPVGADPVALRPGDVLGVGRSLLVFQRE